MHELVKKRKLVRNVIRERTVSLLTQRVSVGLILLFYIVIFVVGGNT